MKLIVLSMRITGFDPTREKVADEHSEIATRVVHLLRLLVAGRNECPKKAPCAIRLACDEPSHSVRDLL